MVIVVRPWRGAIVSTMEHDVSYSGDWSLLNGILCQRETESDDVRRRGPQIEAMIADFDGMARYLDGEIEAEQNRTGNPAPAHSAYSTMRVRCSSEGINLRHSANDLKSELQGIRLARPKEPQNGLTSSAA